MRRVAERWRDEDLLEALPYARGDERDVLFVALGYSEGGATAQLRQLYAAETGSARAAALGAMARRCGVDATDVFVDALRSRSTHVQLAGASALAELGSADAADAVLEWIDRKLGRARREATWDPHELPSAIRFASRHGRQTDVARIIVKHWAGLHQDEQNWLRRTWTALFAEDGSPIVSAVLPVPNEMQVDVYQDERGRSSSHGLDDQGTVLGVYVRRALKNAMRRRLAAVNAD